MATTFEFVHVTHPREAKNRDLQTRVRRHVMRDIGRSRRKAGGPKTEALDGDGAELITRRRVSLRAVDPYGVIGIKLDDRALHILHFMKGQTLDGTRAFHTQCVRMGLSDPTCFNLVLAAGCVIRNQQLDDPFLDFVDNDDSARYYHEAMRQLQLRLADPVERKHPGVLATIVGFICHDACVENWDRWQVHMEGLRQFCALRGGITNVENHIPMMAWWLELVGSSVLDLSPRCEMLYGSSDVPGAIPSSLKLLMARLQSKSTSWSPICTALAQLNTVAMKVNAEGHKKAFWYDHVGAIELIGPVIHHLLSMPRLSDRLKRGSVTAEETCQELARLACLLVLSALRGRLALHGSDFKNTSARFATTAAMDLDSGDDVVLDLTIWSLATVALLKAIENPNLILRKTSELLSIRGTCSPLELSRLMRGIIWIDHIMEPPRL